MKTTAETLRGGLKPHTVDARRIMQAAKNPACAVARTSMLAGIDMEEMVKTAFGAALENQQSPFALRQGVLFERWVTEGGASWLDDGTLLVATALGGEPFQTTSGYARTVRRWRRGTPFEAAPVVLASVTAEFKPNAPLVPATDVTPACSVPPLTAVAPE